MAEPQGAGPSPIGEWRGIGGTNLPYARAVHLEIKREWIWDGGPFHPRSLPVPRRFSDGTLRYLLLTAALFSQA